MNLCSLLRKMRTFTCLGALALTLTASAQTGDNTLYLISNTHLDTQWNWEVTTTIDSYLARTLNENMALMDKYPHFRLSFEGAIKYMWMKEYYPAEYEKLKGYIASGQWHVSGMSIDATDCMISSAESQLHSMLYANKFYMKEFGVRGGHDIMLPDCFGFSYALPTIAAHAGQTGMHSAKLGWGAESYDKLAPFHVWQGVDGSRIYAICKPGAYDNHEEFNKDLTNDATYLNECRTNGTKYGLSSVFRYVGPRSDHGGGLKDDPSSSGENTPYWLEKNAAAANGALKVRIATPDECFELLDSFRNNKYQVWNDELPMRTHGVGAYTSWGMLKRWNRKNEVAADAAEKASALAWWLGVRDYPGNELRDAWIRTIWQQHHDGITGTSTLKANDISYNEYYIANRQFALLQQGAVGAVAQQLDTEVEGTPIVVYNPLSHLRTDIVEGEMACAIAPEGMRVFGPDGREVLSQITGWDEETCMLHFLFAATVPSLGCAVYDVRPGEASMLTSDLTSDATQLYLSNGRYRLTLSLGGDIQQLYDEANGRTLLSNSRLQTIFDREDVWPAWEISYSTVCRTPTNVSGDAAISLVECGPLRHTFRVQRSFQGSTFVQYIRMNALTNRIDVVNEVDWQTSERLLKVTFPFTFSASKATFDISLGTISRGVRTSEHYEMQGHRWADHSNSAAGYGVSILNDCKYGWDKPDNRTLRLTLLHTPSCGSYRHQANMDLGPNLFTYSLFPHDGVWGAATQLEAARLNEPLTAFVSPKHDGVLGRERSFIALSTDSVVITALKRAEDTDELIVRVAEWTGSEQENVRLTFPSAIVTAREVNAIEEEVGTAAFDGNELSFAIGHYQPRTFAVRLASPEQSFKAEPLRGTPATFEYNADVMSDDKTRGNAGRTFALAYPAELIPDTLVAGGLRFVIGDRTPDHNNALCCSAEHTVVLHREPGENCAYLLMASFDEKGSTAQIMMGDTTVMQEVPYFSGRMAEPLTCTSLQSHYRHEDVALVTSHAHKISSRANVTFSEMYIYKYRVPLPEGVDTLTLSSDNHKLLLLACSTADGGADALVPVTPLTTEMDYRELGGSSNLNDNRLVPRTVVASHQNGLAEAGRYANDRDVTTKWCATSEQSKTPTLTYTFAEPVVVERWMVLGAARESGDYVASAFRLQYRLDDGRWVDADKVTDNHVNKVVREVKPFTTTAVRLQMEKGEQDGYTTRIYEFAVYGYLESQTGVELVVVDENDGEDEEWYDLQGRRMDIDSSSLTPGIYIQRGKKMMLPAQSQ
jgi:alpha-mannosidase